MHGCGAGSNPTTNFAECSADLNVAPSVAFQMENIQIRVYMQSAKGFNRLRKNKAMKKKFVKNQK